MAWPLTEGLCPSVIIALCKLTLLTWFISLVYHRFGVGTSPWHSQVSGAIAHSQGKSLWNENECTPLLLCNLQMLQITRSRWVTFIITAPMYCRQVNCILNSSLPFLALTLETRRCLRDILVFLSCLWLPLLCRVKRRGSAKQMTTCTWPQLFPTGLCHGLQSAGKAIIWFELSPSYTSGHCTDGSAEQHL